MLDREPEPHYGKAAWMAVRTGQANERTDRGLAVREGQQGLPIRTRAGCSEQHSDNTIGSMKRAGDGERRLMRQARRRVFIYRRTHIGDPCPCGIFGVHDCMGRNRSWKYDAVIGIGGISPRPVSEGIARRLTWVGIGAHKHPSPWGHSRPYVTFDHFCLMDKEGPFLTECAPLLAKHIFERERIPRWAWSDLQALEIRREIDTLLRRYMKCRPSKRRQCQCQHATQRSSC